MLKTGAYLYSRADGLPVMLGLGSMENLVTTGLMGRTVRQLFAILAVGALFLPFFGPVLDHHFAERQYSHAHIYFGPSGVDHGHRYEEPHMHSLHEAVGGVVVFPSLADTTPDDIVYLTSADGIGRQFAAPFVPATQSATIFPDPDSFILAFAHHDNILHGAFVAPLITLLECSPPEA